MVEPSDFKTKSSVIVLFLLYESPIGTTETKERLFAFLRNSTIPSVSAKRVWSLPIPTFSPGWCCVPRWRTMMLPAMQPWPPKILTPNRFDSDSRPFFELPTPFLCAIILRFSSFWELPASSRQVLWLLALQQRLWLLALQQRLF